VAGSSAPAYAWPLQTLMTAIDEGHRFGASLARAGDTLAIGAPGATAGAVYVLDRSAPLAPWAHVQKLVPPPGFEHVLAFGETVAMAGDRLVVGVAARQAG